MKLPTISYPESESSEYSSKSVSDGKSSIKQVSGPKVERHSEHSSTSAEGISLASDDLSQLSDDIQYQCRGCQEFTRVNIFCMLISNSIKASFFSHDKNNLYFLNESIISTKIA